MVDPYEALLKKAYANVTVQSESTERFTDPEAKVYIEGKTTVLENFAEIADIVRRDQDHLMKFLLGELGTAGKIDGNRAIFNGKFEQSLINGLIRSYVDDYVICSECGKPDTRLVKDDRILLLRCDACGGHRPVRKRRARTEPAGSELQEGQVWEAAMTAAHYKLSNVIAFVDNNGLQIDGTNDEVMGVFRYAGCWFLYPEHKKWKQGAYLPYIPDAC